MKFSFLIGYLIQNKLHKLHYKIFSDYEYTTTSDILNETLLVYSNQVTFTRLQHMTLLHPLLRHEI